MPDCRAFIECPSLNSAPPLLFNVLKQLDQQGGRRHVAGHEAIPLAHDRYNPDVPDRLQLFEPLRLLPRPSSAMRAQRGGCCRQNCRPISWSDVRLLLPGASAWLAAWCHSRRATTIICSPLQASRGAPLRCRMFALTLNSRCILDSWNLHEDAHSFRNYEGSCAAALR